jgi:hypothetical protein
MKLQGQKTEVSRGWGREKEFGEVRGRELVMNAQILVEMVVT